jgi:hypothetical protein
MARSKNGARKISSFGAREYTNCRVQTMISIGTINTDVGWNLNDDSNKK